MIYDMENPIEDETLQKANHDLNEIARDIATLHAQREALRKELHDKEVIIADQYKEIARLHSALNELNNQ